MSQQRGIIAWMVKHGVAPNLLMVFLIIGGLLVLTVMRKEFIPSTEFDVISINVSYPGAAPQELEQGVILPIENELSALDGFSKVSADAFQGSANVFVELELDTNRELAYQEVQQAINNITSFPVGIERPVVRLGSQTLEVVKLALFGSVSRFELKKLAEQIRLSLLQAPELSKVEIKWAPEEEIHIEISQQQLQRFGLSLDEVASIIRDNSIEQSAGSVKTEAGEILVTLDNRLYWADEFKHIPIKSDASGVLVYLEDIATISDGFKESNYEVTFNGGVSMKFAVYRTQDQTPFTVAEATRRELDKIRAALPADVELVITDDDGQTYNDRVGLLLKNAGIGLFLVLLLLTVFLEYRLAFWVTMGIPTAFLGSLLILYALDVSINMISMFAFIIALGIVVDDAIIAGENIFEHMQKGLSFPEAAIEGAKQVATPLSFAILTNIVAFLPLIVIPGVIGKMFTIIPLVVISCFIISWVESLLILPSHLAHLKEPDAAEQPSGWKRYQLRISQGLAHFIEHIYQPVLRLCLKAPSITVALAFFTLLSLLAWAASGRMGFSLFPEVEGEFVVATAELPTNPSIEQLRDVRAQLEQALEEVLAPLEAKNETLIVSVESVINDATVEVEGKLVSAQERALKPSELVDLWREEIGVIPNIKGLSFDSERGGGPSSWPAITIELGGVNSEQLDEASQVVVDLLSQIDGLKDIVNDFSTGKPQWNVELNQRGRSLGLQAGDVANQMRSALYGSQVLRQQREESEVTVLVRLPKSERQRQSDIERLIIQTPEGSFVPLSEVATLQKSFSPAVISRRDGQRIVYIEADVDNRRELPALLAHIENEVFLEIQARFPGLEFGFWGQQAETKKSMNSLTVNTIFALIIMYILLAIPFKSYLQPLLIMAVIPFGAGGAILGHIVLGYSLSVMSIMGIIALAGVVVNDSLILIDHANKVRLEQKLSAAEASLKAGMRRFRPILLTTITTFGGLAPMVFDTSRQTQFIVPMAVSLGFGILFTTVICLLVLPCLYTLLANEKDTA